MTLTKFPEGTNLGYRIVVGGHLNDKSPDEDGNMKTVDPLRQSFSGHPHDELPFITMLRSPTMRNQEETAFPPDPGTCVAVSWSTGDPTSAIVLGMPNEINKSQSVAGNQTVLQHLIKASQYKTGKITSKGSKTTTERGAVVKNTVDGKEWAHQLSEGLATHVAWHPLAGQVLNQIKQIDTAIKQFANIPGLSAMGNLPGQLMNLSSLFQNMTEKQKKQATANMDPLVQKGMMNMLELMAETDVGGMFISDGRVHQETLVNNAIQLFSQATSIPDVIDILQRLRSDISLHGHENLENLEITIEGVHGNVTMFIDATGNVTPTQNSVNIVTQSIETVQNAVSSSQGGGGGKTLFGDAAKLMSEAIGRIPPNIRKNILTSVPEGTKKAKFDDIHKKLLQGENPINLFFSS